MLNNREVEKVLIKTVLENQEYGRCLLKTDLYKLIESNECKKLFGYIKKYYDDYNSIPMKDAVKTIVITKEEEDTEEILKLLEDSMSINLNVKENQTMINDKLLDYYKDLKNKSFAMEMLEVIKNGYDMTDYLEKSHIESKSLCISGYNDEIITMTPLQAYGMLDEERKYHLYPILPEGAYTLLYSPDGVGKTPFAMKLCDCINKGESFGPWENQTLPAKTLYIDGENPFVYSRDLMQQYNCNENFLLIHKMKIEKEWSDTGRSKPFEIELTDKKFQDYILDLIKKENIKMVVLDNLTSLVYGRDENSKSDNDDINSFCLKIRALECGVVKVHHSNKEGNYSGNTAIRRNCDIVYSLYLPKNYSPADGCKMVISFPKLRIKKDKNTSRLIRDRLLWYREEENGHIWQYDDLGPIDSPEIVKMLLEGYKQKEIASKLGVSEVSITRKKKWFFEEDILKKEDNKIVLTEKGKDTFGGMI